MSVTENSGNFLIMWDEAFELGAAISESLPAVDSFDFLVIMGGNEYL